MVPMRSCLAKKKNFTFNIDKEALPRMLNADSHQYSNSIRLAKKFIWVFRAILPKTLNQLFGQSQSYKTLCINKP